MPPRALFPIAALAAIAWIYAKSVAPNLPAEPAKLPKSIPESPVPKPFRAEWTPSLQKERLLISPTSSVCRTPNCQGCDLDKEQVFRKRPGHPKFQR